MDKFKAIRVLAMRDATAKKPSAEAQLRSIFRWYSKEFHTPLHLVEELPIEDVLRHHYEDRYGEWNHSADKEAEHRLEDEIAELSRTDAEQAAHTDREAMAKYEDEKFFNQSAADAAKDAEKKKLQAPAPKGPLVFSAPEEKQALQQPQPPENVRLTFTTDEELERLENMDGASLLGL